MQLRGVGGTTLIGLGLGLVLAAFAHISDSPKDLRLMGGPESLTFFGLLAIVSIPLGTALLLAATAPFDRTLARIGYLGGFGLGVLVVTMSVWLRGADIVDQRNLVGDTSAMQTLLFVVGLVALIAALIWGVARVGLDNRAGRVFTGTTSQRHAG